MQGQKEFTELEKVIRLHLAEAYNFARWLTRSEADSEDVVQEACIRAWKYSSNFRGENSRAWFLTIVRNTTYSWLKKNRGHERLTIGDESLDEMAITDLDPQTLMIQLGDVASMEKALEKLPVEYREVLVLRELEGYSYQEIADITDIPPGTVMSRLSRARTKLQLLLTENPSSGGRP